MKTQFKQLAAMAIFAIIFLAGNVHAKGNKAIIVSGLETTVETTLEMENWMTDASVWNTTNFVGLEIEAESEVEMEMENWMTDTETWEVMPNLVQETDSDLELEQWMLNENNWKI